MMQRWVAVQSSHTAQGRVCLGLQDYLGIDCVFMPMRAYWARFRFGERNRRVEPLFDGYTFARVIPEHIGEICDIDGVQDVLRCEVKPLFIPDEAIDALRRAWRGRIFDETRDQGLPIGTEVLITSGPFAGLVGKIKSASKKHRPRVLLHFLGRVTESSIPIDRLERVEA